MKVLVVLSIFALSVSYSRQNEALQWAVHLYYTNTAQYIDQCLTETNTSRELYEEFDRSGNIIDDVEFRCFLWCMFTKPGYIDDKGMLDIDVVSKISEITDQKVLDNIESNCRKMTAEDNCYAARDMVFCLIDVLTK